MSRIRLRGEKASRPKMKRCAVEILQKGNYYEMTAFVSLFLLCLLVSNEITVSF